MKSHGLDKAKDTELELHFLFHKEIKALDVGVMEAMLETAARSFLQIGFEKMVRDD